MKCSSATLLCTVKAVATLQTTHLPAAGGDVVLTRKSQSELMSSQSHTQPPRSWKLIEEDIRVKFIQYYDDIDKPEAKSQSKAQSPKKGKDEIGLWASH